MCAEPSLTEPTLYQADLSLNIAGKKPNPQAASSSVGNARYDCFYYSKCLGVAAKHSWTGLSCEACTAHRPIPSEAIPFDACAQLLGAVLRTAQHDLDQGLDDSFWEAAAFVFHQTDFAVLCGLLDIDPHAARQAQWERLAPPQKCAITERWPQATEQLS
ncbi:MAG: hypothetical protein V3U27_16430 [Candidatus Tectomicrobia bacterium]